VIELQDAVTGYGRVRVLDGVSLRLDEGEVLSIIGPNGAGKTTLVMLLAGQRRLWSGRLEFRGEDVGELGSEDRTVRGIVLCPEGRQILASLTVEENLRVGATPLRARLGKSDAQTALGDDLDRAYELFPILSERRSMKGGSLSGGEQQMLAIARALMARPTVLLLDEPSLGLAPRIIEAVYSLLARLRDEGLTMVVVEESPERALQVADRAMVLRNGSVVAEGTAEEIGADPSLHRAYLGSVEPGGEGTP
jgi:branched-chain amino acid transport system ATP-binding protein